MPVDPGRRRPAPSSARTTAPQRPLPRAAGRPRAGPIRRAGRGAADRTPG